MIAPRIIPGLKYVHELTKTGTWTLRIELGDWDGESAMAEYRDFTIGSESDNFRLSIGTYSGTAGKIISCNMDTYDGVASLG